MSLLNTALRYLLFAGLLAAVGILLLVGAQVERRFAEADRDLATLNLSRAARGYDEVANSLGWIARIPWLFDETTQRIESRSAAVQFWQGNFNALMAEYAAPDSPSIGNNVDLQFIVANADYLSRLRPGGSRDLALGALDQGIGVYRRLLETNDTHLEAAFNYELLIRLRAEIAAGESIPDLRLPTVPGNPGENPEEEMIDDVQIYVPRDRLTDPEDTDNPTIGEGALIRKRG